MPSTTDQNPGQPADSSAGPGVRSGAEAGSGTIAASHDGGIVGWFERLYERFLDAYRRLMRLPEWLLVSVFLLGVTLIGLFTYTRALGSQLWMDEAITIGIASHPLSAIPGIMRMDGAPPLFYMLLHIWMRMFGDSESQTHALSVLFAVIAIPTSYWGARTLLDKRTAVFTATLFSTNAFMIGYSTETRMYALMVLLGLLTSIGYVACFVQRRRRFLPLFTVGQALMLYTHSWGLFFGAASFISLALVWRLLDEEQRHGFIRDAAIAYIAVAVLYIPWVPTFLYQARHTAAPWDAKPRFGLVIQIARSVMGSIAIGAVTFAVGIYGLWRLFGAAASRTREAKVLYVLLAIVALTFAMAWISSQITPAWVPRYFAPTVGPILLMLGLGFSRSRALGVLALLLACTTVVHPHVYAPPNKSDMRQIAGEMAMRLRPGDLVIVGQPEQTPLAFYYLPGGLRFANTQAGLVKDPSFMNWQDALAKYKRANPAATLAPLLASLKVGQRLLYIQPLTEGNGQWTQSWTQMIRLRSAQWGQIIADDPELREIGWAPHVYSGACCVADSAVLYKKVS